VGWLQGWRYRRAILIDNTKSANALSDYQVPVTVNTAALIAEGKMMSDCRDIRFTDSDGQTPLPYWIESGVNTASTLVWVRVPSIPASSTKTIYMYYGNPLATSASDGNSVFLFFDSFESGLTKWATSGTVTTSFDYAYEGKYSLKCGAGISYAYNTGFSPSTNIAVHVRYYDRMTAATEAHMLAAWDGTTKGLVGVDDTISASYYVYRIGDTYYVSNVARARGWHKFVITHDGARRQFWIDDYLMPNSDAVALSRFDLGSWWSVNREVSYFDIFYVRRYVTPDPTASVGAEEYIATGMWWQEGIDFRESKLRPS
jgi:hypothetical protein